MRIWLIANTFGGLCTILLDWDGCVRCKRLPLDCVECGWSILARGILLVTRVLICVELSCSKHLNFICFIMLNLWNLTLFAVYFFHKDASLIITLWSINLHQKNAPTDTINYISHQIIKYYNETHKIPSTFICCFLLLFGFNIGEVQWRKNHQKM